MRHKSFSNIYKPLLGGVMLAVLATGCTNEDFNSPSTDEKDAVVISGGVTTVSTLGTRAADAAWAANDRIGITMLSTATSDVFNGYSNRDYVTVGGDGTFVANVENNKMYYPIDGSEVTFKAYYPYTGLTGYPNFPLDVSGQATLADKDLMTAVHTNTDNSTANSKDNPDAHLVFHHRMTLVNVNLLTETGSPITLDDETELVIKGMKTTGNYNLMTGDLTPDPGSVGEINIPLSPSHTGRAILLPREAAPGVTFEVTLGNGGVYTAEMDEDLDLKGGSKYTFNLTLKTTPALITASIEDWTDGPVKDYEVVHLVTSLGTNQGFVDDSQLKLYAKDTGESIYAKKGTFAYDETNDKWQSGTPIYWEGFTGPNVDFQATSVYAGKLNPSQMDDYLIGETTGVSLYGGLHLEMKHVGAKVTVKLSSSDGTYTAAELDDATITLPGYRNDGSLDDVIGAFIIKTGTGDITPEKQGSATPEERVAIFPPQVIKANETLVQVVINGHTYNVTVPDAFEFEAGKRHEIRLNIQKSGVSMTVSLKDWEDGGDYEATVRIGTPIGTSTNENLLDNDELKLFTEVTSGTREPVRGHFTYNGGAWTYSEPDDPLFWEELPATGKIYAQMERNAVNGSLENQSPDYIVATPVDNYGGTGATGTRIDFTMEHAVSQVRVVLRPSDTYTTTQLQSAVITLPGYAIGGSLNNGIYVPGTNNGNIRLDEPNNTDVSTRTYLQPQPIPSGQNVVMVTIPGSVSPSGSPRTYPVTYNHPVEYNAGEITHLYITIEGSEVLVSVKVTDWDDQTPVELNYSFNEEETNVEDFEVGEIITFHRLDENGDVIDTKDYEVEVVNGKKELVPVDGTPWFRDDFKDGDRIVAVYPDGSSTYDVPKGENTFDVDMDGKSDPADPKNDILVASDGEIEDGEANVGLNFEHVLSKVTVNIFRGAGFEPDEISGANPVVELINFFQKGTVNINDGTASNLSDPQTFEPTKLGTPNTGAELSYQALILPQSKAANIALVQITFGGNTYYAEYSTAFNFEAGKHNVLNITLAKTELKLSAKIAPWEDGDSGSITID